VKKVFGEQEYQKHILNCQKEYLKLSDQTKAILWGLVLGDGSIKIHKGYKHARLSFRHSTTQQEYFEWKRDQLRPELSASAHDTWEQTVPEKSEEYGKQKLRYQSGAKPSLTYIYYLTHKGSERDEIKIWRTWLNEMTPLSLAVWWCDDGSLVGNASQGIFCTDGFGEENVRVLDRYMKMKWGITTTIMTTGKYTKTGIERYRLTIKTHEDLKKFLRIIMPYIPTQSMLKKVLLLYNDADLQQRWISEMVTHTTYQREQLEELCETRKAQYKAFKSENDIVHSPK